MPVEGRRKIANSPHHFHYSPMVVLDTVLSALVSCKIHTSCIVHENPPLISLLANEGLDENPEVWMTPQHLLHDPTVAL